MGTAVHAAPRRQRNPATDEFRCAPSGAARHVDQVLRCVVAHRAAVDAGVRGLLLRSEAAGRTRWRRVEDPVELVADLAVETRGGGHWRGYRRFTVVARARPRELARQAGSRPPRGPGSSTAALSTTCWCAVRSRRSAFPHTRRTGAARAPQKWASSRRVVSHKCHGRRGAATTAPGE